MTRKPPGGCANAAGLGRDDLPDSNSLDRSQIGQGLTSQDYTRTSQEVGCQEEASGSTIPEFPEGVNDHAVKTEGDALQDSNGLNMRRRSEEDVPARPNTIVSSQDRGREGKGGLEYVATPTPSDSQPDHQAARAEGADFQDSNGLDMRGRREEDVPTSLYTIVTSQDRGLEGLEYVDTTAPSDSQPVHQAARTLGPQEVDLLDTRSSSMSCTPGEDALTRQDTISSCQEDGGGGHLGSAGQLLDKKEIFM